MKYTIYVCDNCGARYDRDANDVDESQLNLGECGEKAGTDFIPLALVEDLADRLDPGSVVPHGECTALMNEEGLYTCGALVYSREVEAA